MVTGAAGQLGQAITKLFGQHGPVAPFTREALDITDHVAVGRAVAEVRPSALINCAAYNRVDDAEGDAVTALAINAMAVRTLARAAAGAGATFVHYGTDFVFGGDATTPYTEDAQPRPGSVYAASKLIGEWMAAIAPAHYVLRVESLFGGEYKLGSSIDRIVAAIEQRQPARVFSDRVCSPSYVHDVAWATAELLARRAPYGLYHCVNSGACTWLELAEEAARQMGIEANLIPTKVADVQMRAARPQYAALSPEKLRMAGVAMPTWQDALGRYLTALRERRGQKSETRT